MLLSYDRAMRRLVSAFSLLAVLVFGVFAEAKTFEELGIRYREVSLQEGYQFAYLTAGYDYGPSGASEADRVVLARFFLVSNRPQSEPMVRDFLRKRFPRKPVAAIDSVRQIGAGDTALTLASLRDRHVFEISSLFPWVMRFYLGRGGEVVSGLSTCSNCFGAARSFYSSDRVMNLDEHELRTFLAERRFRRVSNDHPPQFGEVLILTQQQHAAVYLFDGLVFQKPTWGVFHNYEIVPYVEVFATMNRTIAYLSNGAPAGSATPSAWDIFVSNLWGALPLAPPPALVGSSIKDVERYLPSQGE